MAGLGTGFGSGCTRAVVARGQVLVEESRHGDDAKKATSMAQFGKGRRKRSHFHDKSKT